jgi:hypothetical protein
MPDQQFPKRNVRINVTRPGAPAWKLDNFFLLDPENPLMDPNELLKLRKGHMADPDSMNHNCPCCNLTLSWDMFKAHWRGCYISWRKVRLDITKRKFAGASLEDVE